FYTDLTKITLLLFGALLITRHRLLFVLALSPLFVATMLLGDTRINMIAVTVVFYLLLIERRLNHPLMYVFMGYMSLKSITFLYNILVYGDGFQQYPELINWSLIFV
ncbi:MAG: hypothetical protein EBU84_21595, partial [Actinobacteria bacterium]|nr:hypothetical protein [Actinomycetota bacterium]